MNSINLVVNEAPVSHGQTRSDNQIRAFGQAILKIQKKIEQDLGERDAQYIQRIVRFSRAMEASGRFLIHVSIEPFSFSAGVFALWVHKQLEASEIGHMALHGAYDRFNMPMLHSKTFSWDFPVDEASWRYGHNVSHHGFTNISGADPDVQFGFVRLTPETPHRWIHYFQMPTVLFFIIPNFGSAINTHVCGLLEGIISTKGQGPTTKKNRSAKTVINSYRKAFRKWVPYYGKNFIFYPVLAGPFFPKVVVGNWLAEKFRDVYTGITVFCGHVDTKSYSLKDKPKNHGEWCIMQIEATNNFKVSYPLSILCGGLDYQIEHHLFPKLPPNRLREVSSEIEACCQEFGVTYNKDTWPGTLKRVIRKM